METFLVSSIHWKTIQIVLLQFLGALDPERSPGQQAVNCSQAKRSVVHHKHRGFPLYRERVSLCSTPEDELRHRDRYECTLDNHPPLEGRQTALAETVAHFMEAQQFAVSDIRISGS